MINEWAHRHNITPEAYTELLGILQAGYIEPDATAPPMSETGVTQRIRLDVPRRNARLMRNNRGVGMNPQGQPVRFGLCNDSESMGKKYRSADLIGLISYVVKPHDVGRVLGIFYAVEVKKRGWRFRATEHELAQQRFLNFIMSMGGIAQFAQDPGDLII